MLSEHLFLEFYRESAVPLRNYIVKTMGTVNSADDIVQEAYLRILRHPPPSETVPEMRAYVFRIASNLIVDRWRKQKHENSFSQTLNDDPVYQDGGSPLDMQRTFLKLRPMDRQIMWLAYVEGANHREIAASLNLKERSIRVLLLRARNKLKELLSVSAVPPRQTDAQNARQSSARKPTSPRSANELKAIAIVEIKP